MSWVSDEQIERAREIDLLSYMQAYEPFELKRDGSNRYVTESHGSLVISNGKWIWNQGQCGGVTALDYLTKVRGVGFVEAVELLTGERAATARSYQEEAKKQPPPKKRLFSPPRQLRFATYAMSYLQDRGIHPDVISRCIRSGLLYEGRHDSMAVCVFVGRDENGKERFACMRGLFSDLKRDAVGSDKKYSFCYPAINSNSRHLAVFEAPIDALSHATMQIRENWKWDGHRLSLGGTSSVALISFLERNPQIARIALCLDNDEAGKTVVEKIQRELDADERFSHIRVTVHPPSVGKDYLAAVTDEIERLVRVCYGHAAVLFTSYKAMDIVWERLSARRMPFPMFRLDRGGACAISSFKASNGGVLFASGAMWEGIDIPGDALTLLIIVRLPFSAPDPISEYERTLFGSLREYKNAVIIPDMLVRYRQGFGRPFRLVSDTGVVAILDSRACWGAAYHNQILTASPDCRITDRVDDISRFLVEKKAPDYFSLDPLQCCVPQQDNRIILRGGSTWE